MWPSRSQRSRILRQALLKRRVRVHQVAQGLLRALSQQGSNLIAQSAGKPAAGGSNQNDAASSSQVWLTDVKMNERARKLAFYNRLGKDASVGPLSGSHEKMTGSGSDMDVPSRTAKNRALLRPRLSPPNTSGSRRLARAAQQILHCVHAGNEREAVSSRGPRPPLLSRTRQYDTRATIPARASWRLQRARWRGLAGIGIRRRLDL